MRNSVLPAALVLALAGAPAFSQEAVATASGAPAPAPAADTAVQIETWLAAAPPVDLKDADSDGTISLGKRRVHGEVGVAVGTGGYRSAYMLTEFPVGETGALSVAVSETRNGYGFGSYPHAYGPGIGPGARRTVDLHLAMGPGASRPSCDPVEDGVMSGVDAWGRTVCRTGRPRP